MLTFFITLKLPLGYLTIIIAHVMFCVMFCVSFVAITVRARALTLDPYIEEAARDLDAGPWDTFRLVTLPMIFPAVLAGALRQRIWPSLALGHERVPGLLYCPWGGRVGGDAGQADAAMVVLDDEQHELGAARPARGRALVFETGPGPIVLPRHRARSQAKIPRGGVSRSRMNVPAGYDELSIQRGAREVP